jgi:hypothetical protein
MIDSNEKEEELMSPRPKMDEEVEEPTMPRSKMGSNDLKNTPKEISSIHSIRHKGP